MPSTRSIERELGVSYPIISHSVARCVFGQFCEHINEDEAEQLRQHFWRHQVHWPRNPQWRERFAEQIAQATPSSGTQRPRPVQSTPRPPRRRPEVEVGIGADPELEVISERGTARAVRNSQDRRLGADGAGALTWEIRPGLGQEAEWFRDPFNSYRDIDEALNEVARQAGRSMVRAGSGTNRSTGGHIHISGLPGRPSPALGQALDRFIRDPLNERSRNRRVRGSYDISSNASNAWRQKPWGWEYRSPLSWLAHPILTKGALVIAAIVARNHMNPPMDTEELADRARGAEERVAVEGFYAFLGALQVRDQHLEDLEVLRMWGKRRQASETPVRATTEAPQFRVSVTNDDDMPTEPISFREEPQVGFVGAREDRASNSEVVFLPERLAHRVDAVERRVTGICGNVQVITWERSSVGLSVRLRAYHREGAPDSTHCVRDVILAILEGIHGQ